MSRDENDYRTAKQGALGFDALEKSITVSRAARLLGYSRDTVLRKIESGEIEAYRVFEGGWWRVSLASVMRLRQKAESQLAGEEIPPSRRG